MKNLPAPTAKDINEAHRLARSSAETAVEHAIRCGHLLIRMQDELDRGQIRPWIEKRTDIAWSTAQRYMNAARKNAQGIAFESLRHCFPSGKQAKPESVETEIKSPTAVGDSVAAAAVPAAFSGSVEAEQDSDAPERPDDIEDAEEAAALQRAEAEHERTIDRLFEGKADARAEIERLTALVGALEVARDGQMNKAESITQLLKAEQRKSARLEKRVKDLQNENDSLKERVAIMEAA